MANTVLANLIVKIGADTKGVSEGLGRMDKGLKNIRTQMTKTRNVAGLLAGAAGFGFVTKQLFEIGSAVEETASKFNTVFGESAESVQGFIDQFATMAGLSNEAAQGVLATTGSIVQGMGFAQEASAQFATQVVELAGDLSSFNNIPIGETALAIQAALTGEREQMKRLGIVLREADVQQRALTLSGKTVASALTDQERATATLALITERAGFAVGDLERTQFSAANQARALGADIQNIKESIATALLPVLSIAVGGFSKFIKGMQIMGAEAAVFAARLRVIEAALTVWDRSALPNAIAQLNFMKAAAEEVKLQIVGLSFATDGLTNSLSGDGGTTGAVSKLSGAVTILGQGMIDLTNKAVRLALGFSSTTPTVTILDQGFIDLSNDAVRLALGFDEITTASDRMNSALSKTRGILGGLGSLGALAGLAIPGLGAAGLGLSAFSGLKGVFGGGKADGGPVSSGKSFVVGERGPELFVPSQSGTIIPNGGGGDTFVQIVTQDGRALTDKINVTQQRDGNLRRIVRVPIAAMAF